MVLIRVQVLGCHALVRSDCFDNTGKTGSYVVIGLLPSNVDTEASEKRIKLNQTAVVENNINPEFPENCTIFDLNAPEQRVYFDVYQCQHGKDDRICSLKTTVGELMNGPPTPHRITYPLRINGDYKFQSYEPSIDLYIYPPWEIPIKKDFTIEQTIDKLSKEIKGRKSKHVIDKLEETLSKNVKELSNNEHFFQLPLSNIFSVISKINFNSIEENGKIFEIIHNIIKNTVNAHFEEKETILLLQYVDISQYSFSYEESFSILDIFINCSFLHHFCNLHKEIQQIPEKDFEYELKKRDKEIEVLKKQICFPLILEKPKDFETNIFKACKEGKLSSVQWLIEKENVYKNIKVEKTCDDLFEGDTPIHIASYNGHHSIVQYFIEKQHVEVDIKGWAEKTPLHYACQNGHLPIVEYLISNGSDANTKYTFGDYAIHFACENGHLAIVRYLIEKQNVDKDIEGDYNRAPLHYACREGHFPIVEYLVSKGANIEAKDTFSGATPLHTAVLYDQTDIVTFLVSKGANKNAINEYGETPFYCANNDEIKNILK